MGSKSHSKEIMLAAGVPCVPGYHGNEQTREELEQRAEQVGYPLMIKAVKGGGGKGMRIVSNKQEFGQQLESARREAEKAFGDTTVLIERYLQNPRHVEVQIFADVFGNCVYIWERDCSVQRRHQKIIEEAPAPNLSEELRRDLGEKAVKAAKAVGYVGAGTVEFILDEQSNEFFFMEMNTRLQVEHPVSEMISGLDLVEWQLIVASGNPLPLTQSQIPFTGHAFEARIYAENTRNGFLPDVGHLSYVSLPQTSENVRIDTGFDKGDDISVHYDSMISKLIVKGRDRNEALMLMRKALSEYKIVGTNTNIEFLSNLTRHEAFIRGEVETGFIQKYGHELQPPLPVPSSSSLIQAALYLYLRDSNSDPSTTTQSASAWTSANLSSFRISSTSVPTKKIHLLQKGKKFPSSSSASSSSESGCGIMDTIAEIEIQPTIDAQGQTDFSIQVKKLTYSSTEEVPLKELSQSEVVEIFDRVSTKMQYEIDGGVEVLTSGISSNSNPIGSEDYPAPLNRSTIISRLPNLLTSSKSSVPSIAEKLDLFDSSVNSKSEEHRLDPNQIELLVLEPEWLKEVLGKKAASKGSVTAPMPSKVVELRCKVGDEVTEGDVLVVLEAMKTEHVLRAPKNGKVQRLAAASPGEMVAEGTELVVFEDVEEE